MRRIVLLCLGFLLCLTAGCQTQTPLSETRFLLDTDITVTLYATDDETLLQAAFARAEELERLLSRTVPGSDADRINNAGGNPVEVSEETAVVLEAALQYAELSDGLYDITVAPALSLWNFTGEDPQLPDPAVLSAAAEKADIRMLRLDGRTVTLPAGMEIDLGSLAKGYIADEMAKVLREKGVTSALLNLGGDLIAIGIKPNGAAFRIGIQEPFGKRGTTAKTVPLTNAIATSGVYERGFSYDGVWYHHILDPNTGYPVQNGVLSASVSAESAMQADALATIAVLCGADKAEALVTEGGGVLEYLAEGEPPQE